MRKWRYAWRWHVQHIMRSSDISVLKPWPRRRDLCCSTSARVHCTHTRACRFPGAFSACRIGGAPFVVNLATRAPADACSTPATVTEYATPAPVIELNCVSPFQQFPHSVESSAPQVDGLRPLLGSRIQRQSVEDVKVRRVRSEEQSGVPPDPPTVEEFGNITCQERFSGVHCGLRPREVNKWERT